MTQDIFGRSDDSSMGDPNDQPTGYPQRRRPRISGRIIIALIIALFAIIRYWSSSEKNHFTGEKQHVGSITPEQEVGLGLQAAPEMIQQHGGELRGGEGVVTLNKVGQELLEAAYREVSGEAPKYPFKFHLLADPKTINAFALPGGQVFITAALFEKLETEGQLAGVIGHEIGHVLARHGAEHIAKAELTQGLTGAAVMAAYDPDNPSTARSAQMIQLVGQMVNMKFGRDDELEADKLGVTLSAKAGYDPEAMIGVMKILEEATQGQAPPEIMSTHPKPENRIGYIQDVIRQEFPNGVPRGLKK